MTRYEDRHISHTTRTLKLVSSAYFHSTIHVKENAMNIKQAARQYLLSKRK